MKLVVTYHGKNYEHAKWNRIAKAALQVWRVVRGYRCTQNDLYLQINGE